MARRIEVGLLGPVALRVDGNPVGVDGAPQRAILARLALTPGRIATPALLVDTLWPAGSPSNAGANVQVYVSRLRRLVGAERLVREAGGYRLHVDDVDVDVVRGLEAKARQAGTAEAAELLGAALRVWRGDPLADVADPLPFAPELARLAEWRRQLQDEWFALRLASGEAARLLPDLEHAVAADPLREAPALALAQAMHRLGRTPEALRVLDALRRRTVEDSGLDPSPAVRGLQARLLAGDPVRAPRSAPARHAPDDRFVGREPELGALAAALRAHRLVTLVGPGGVGKTRLALEALDRHGGPRAFVVPLADVSEPADVVEAAAAALGLLVAPGGVEAAVADLVGTGPALLLLDNCEHVLGGVRELVAGLLRRCAALRVLATSRQRLDLAGEQVVPLGPLGEDDRVALFVDRASHLRLGFDASGPARDVVASICGILDGLPLAVELAARREAVFGLVALRERLGAGLDVLEPARDGGRTTAVTATVEWSYRLLDRDAQRLFDRLAVCRDGFTLDALAHLAPGNVANPAGLLAELVEASLVVADPAAARPRFRLLEVMRRVALTHLRGDELAAAHAGHAGWMRAVGQRGHRMQCERAPEAAETMAAERANLREAIRRAADTGDGDLAGELGLLVAAALSDDPDLPMIGLLRRLAPYGGGEACAAAGAGEWFHGDAAAADALLGRALGLLPHAHPRRWIAQLFRLWARMPRGDPDDVEADARALRGATAVPDWAAAVGWCCAALTSLYTGEPCRAGEWMARERALLDRARPSTGFIAYAEGELLAATDPLGALVLFDEAHRVAEAHGQRFDREVAGVARAAVLIRLGRVPDAARACRTSIENLRATGMWPQLWTLLRLAAELLADRGDPESAAVLLAAADADPLAPAVLGPERDRQAALRSAIGERLVGGGAAADEGARCGRAAAVRRARRALGALC